MFDSKIKQIIKGLFDCKIKQTNNDGLFDCKTKQINKGMLDCKIKHK